MCRATHLTSETIIFELVRDHVLIFIAYEPLQPDEDARRIQFILSNPYEHCAGDEDA